MNLQRIVLLGNDGFIGPHLEAAMRQRYPRVDYVGFSVANIDLRKSADALVPVFDRQTAVVMTAGVKRQWGDTLDAFSQNISIAVNVARVLQTQPVGRFIFFSSAAVYGEEHQDVSITEATPVRPTSLYGAAKFAAECVLQKVTPNFVAVRPPLIYGPGDTSQSYGPAGFVHAAKNHEPVTLWGEGDEQREFVFVLDVAELIVRLLASEFTGALNLASARAGTFRQAAELAGATINTRPRSKPRVDHGFNNARLRGLFPDFPFTDLETGIQRMLV